MAHSSLPETVKEPLLASTVKEPLLASRKRETREYPSGCEKAAIHLGRSKLSLSDKPVRKVGPGRG